MRQDFSDQMPLPLAVDLPVEASLEVVSALIDAGADVNAERVPRPIFRAAGPSPGPALRRPAQSP